MTPSPAGKVGRLLWQTARLAARMFADLQFFPHFCVISHCTSETGLSHDRRHGLAGSFPWGVPRSALLGAPLMRCLAATLGQSAYRIAAAVITPPNSWCRNTHTTFAWSACTTSYGPHAFGPATVTAALWCAQCLARLHTAVPEGCQSPAGPGSSSGVGRPPCR